MTVVRAVLFVPELLVVLASPPLLASVIAKTKAWFGGRVGPPWLQPYYDLHKLIQKDAVYSKTTTWLFRAGPVISLAALLTAATLVPVLSDESPLGFSGDVILFAYLLALGRMFTVLAAMDTGSSFEGMGASREVTFGAMSEPALFLSFVVMAVASKSLRLSEMIGPSLLPEWRVAGPAIILVVGALLVVLLTETCRVPVDDPATHLELTMIHEVMVLDHSGPWTVQRKSSVNRMAKPWRVTLPAPMRIAASQADASDFWVKTSTASGSPEMVTGRFSRSGWSRR